MADELSLAPLISKRHTGEPDRFAGYARYNFIGGHNDPEHIPIDALVRCATTSLSREGRRLAMYNLGLGPQGYPPLREFVAGKLCSHRGATVDASQVMITSGSGQGITLVCRTLLDPGDVILCEEFSYSGAINTFKKFDVDIVGVALDDKGILPSDLKSKLAQLKREGRKPKFLYTIPTVQNPTGSILPAERRETIVEICRVAGIAIFEDECYADLVFEPHSTKSLLAYAPDVVIHIGSFSKNLSPALRLGYAIAPLPILERMVSLKDDGGTGALDQIVTAEFFSEHFNAHIGELSQTLQKKRDVMVDALTREFGTSIEIDVPAGGIFVWARLPPATDVRKLLKPMSAAGVSFNAGPEWACSPEDGANKFRLCFALPNEEDIRDGVAVFAKVCFDTFGFPSHGDNKARRSLTEEASQ